MASASICLTVPDQRSISICNLLCERRQATSGLIENHLSVGGVVGNRAFDRVHGRHRRRDGRAGDDLGAEYPGVGVGVQQDVGLADHGEGEGAAIVRGGSQVKQLKPTGANRVPQDRFEPLW